MILMIMTTGNYETRQSNLYTLPKTRTKMYHNIRRILRMVAVDALRFKVIVQTIPSKKLTLME